jgi:peptide/nickel transport system substrate-binding protein
MERVRVKRRYGVSVVLFALLLSGLPVNANAVVPDDTVTIATYNPLVTLNPYSIDAYGTTVEIQTLTSMGFNYWSRSLQKVQNSQFGSYTVLSTSPLTVRFTVRNGARWSDGVPITAVDLLFSHLISSSAYAQSAGLIGSGSSKSTFDSNRYGNAYDQAIVLDPVLSSDKQSLTLTYSKTFPDWELFTPTPFPVHALELVSTGVARIPSLSESLVAKSNFETSFRNKTTGFLKKYADTFNLSYNIKEVNEKTNPLLLVANGPYQLEFADQNSIRLKKNLNYNSGPLLSGINSIHYKVIPDGSKYLEEVKKGEIDISQGQATVDGAKSYKDITQNRFVSYDWAAFEHIDLRVGSGTDGGTYTGPFAGNSSKARDLRSAFLLAFPREEILREVIQPIAPHAILPTSLLLSESESNHDELSIQSGFMAKYSDDDLSRQRAALKIVKSHFPNATANNPVVDVKILYGTPTNARRVAVIQLAKVALAKSGFNLIPDVQSGWSTQLTQSKHDAYFFAWVKGIATNRASLEAYCTDCGNNFLGYSNQIVDQNYKILNSNIFSTQDKLKANIQIEAQLVSDAISLPLFRQPLFFSVNPKLSNFIPSILPESYLWNFWEWSKSTEGLVDYVNEQIDESNALIDVLNAYTEEADDLNARVQDVLDSKLFTNISTFSSRLVKIKRILLSSNQSLTNLKEIGRSNCGFALKDISNTDQSNAAIDVCNELLDAVENAKDSFAITEEAMLDAEAYLAELIATEDPTALIAKQEADAKAAADLKAKQEADAKAAADLKAKQEADAKAAADLKAKQEADAKAAAALRAQLEADAKAAAALRAQLEADAKAAAALKAKQEADAKAAADLKAKQEADAKAAADLKAKQEADAKAAAEKTAADIKAKQDADTKAAAAKAAAAKAAAAKAAAAKAAAAKAKKSPTVTCKKGSIVKVFVGKQCPPGYKK